MIDHLKKWGVAHLALLTALASAAFPFVSQAIAANPKLSGVLAGLGAWIAAVKKSPLNVP
jgi:hypothetical protein